MSGVSGSGRRIRRAGFRSVRRVVARLVSVPCPDSSGVKPGDRRFPLSQSPLSPPQRGVTWLRVVFPPRAVGGDWGGRAGEARRVRGEEKPSPSPDKGRAGEGLAALKQRPRPMPSQAPSNPPQSPLVRGEEMPSPSPDKGRAGEGLAAVKQRPRPMPSQAPSNPPHSPLARGRSGSRRAMSLFTRLPCG
jgi:hypothetical protein